MNYHVLYNPTAKHHKNSAILERVENFFDNEGINYVVHFSEYQGHIELLAKELSQDENNVLIVVGGDGTIHEVLNGIVDPTKTEICIIPAGTGNDFAAAAGLGFDVEQNLDILLHGEAKETDYIEVFGRRCMNAGGLGIDVDVLQRCEKGIFKGKIKYLMSLCQSAFCFRGYRVRILINGEEINENVLFAEACNGHRFGGGIVMCPGAKIDDGKMEVVVVPKLGFFDLISTFIAVLRGKILTRPNTKHYYCDEVEIYPDTPRAVQLDGEIYNNCACFKATLKHGLKIYR